MKPEILIPLLVLGPLMGGLAIPLLSSRPQGSSSRWSPAGAGSYALLISLFTFAVSVVLAVQFLQWNAPDNLAFPAARVAWVEAFGLSFSFALIDAISLWLVLLTTFLMPLVILGSFSAVKERAFEFYMWLLILEAAMLGAFLATDLIFFYVCFEFTLVPLYFLIGIFGSTQRLRAARVFFLYTFTGSMLTFAGILYVAWFNTTLSPEWFPGAGQWTFDIRTLYETASHLSPTQQRWVLLALLAGFAVKVPLFPVHTWLPLAHTEAPTAGSVILAGVLLKLGTYGLLRFAIPMCPDAVVAFAPAIATLAVIGILYAGLVCWVQKDIKKLIAYSSVSHLGFCVLGMFALTTVGGAGSVIYMINHGLSTGALFLCVGMIYERFHTREMAAMSGLARVIPVWAFFFVYFCLASVGLPGLNGFVGEFLTLLASFDWRNGALGPAYTVFAGVGMIIGAIYILYMVGKVVFGPVKVPAHDSHDPGHAHDHRPAVPDLNLREITVLVPLAVACLVLGLYPTPLLKAFEEPVTVLNARAQSVLVQKRSMGQAAAPVPVSHALADAGDELILRPTADPALGADALKTGSATMSGLEPSR